MADVKSRFIISGRDDTKRAFASVRRSLNGTKSSLLSLKSALVGGIGLFGLARGFSAVIKATAEQERVTAQLNAVLKSTGGAAGVTAAEMLEYAASLQKVTKFGDEAVIGVENVLLTFTKLTDDVLKAAIESVLDISTALGTDLTSAAQQLGKALNDPISQMGALSRSGIILDDTQKALVKRFAETNRLAEAQKIILSEVRTEFGGSARAARDTFGGALESVKNAFGDLLEGENGLNDAKEALNGFVILLSSDSVKSAADSFISTLVNGFSSVVRFITSAKDEIQRLDAAFQFMIGNEQIALTKYNALMDELMARKRAAEEEPPLKIDIEGHQEDMAEIVEIDRKSADESMRIFRRQQEEQKRLDKETRAAVMGTAINIMNFSQGQSKKLFALAKAGAIAQTTIDTYKAATAALAGPPGPPWSLPFVALAISTGLANLAVIRGTNFQGQAHGGLDYVPREGTYLLDQGERVINSDQNKRFDAFLDTGTGTVVNVNIDARGASKGVDTDIRRLVPLIERVSLSAVQKAYNNRALPGPMG